MATWWKSVQDWTCQFAAFSRSCDRGLSDEPDWVFVIPRVVLIDQTSLFGFKLIAPLAGAARPTLQLLFAATAANA
jgi:hypothetical protein